MKSNQEIAASVFEKSRVVIRKRRERRKKVAAASAVFAVAAVVTVLAFTNKDIISLNADPPVKEPVSSAATGESALVSFPIESDSDESAYGSDRSENTTHESSSKTNDSSYMDESSEASSQRSSSSSSRSASSESSSASSSSPKQSSAASREQLSSDEGTQSSVSSTGSSSKSTSSKAASSKNTSSKAASSKATSSKTTSSKTTSSKTTSSKTTSSKTTSSKTESSKPESSKPVEGSRPTHSSKPVSTPESRYETDTTTDSEAVSTDAEYTDVDFPSPNEPGENGDPGHDDEPQEGPEEGQPGDAGEPDTDAETSFPGDECEFVEINYSSDYMSSQELINASDMIIYGTITDVEFVPRNGATSRLAQDSPVYKKSDVSELFTVYTISVDLDYTPSTEYIRSGEQIKVYVYGGIMGVYHSEQKNAAGTGAIPYVENQLEHPWWGNSALFMLKRDKTTGLLTLTNYTKGILNEYYDDAAEIKNTAIYMEPSILYR